ncbi:MAG: LicD family protein [Eubacterium sp.]|nr:LicD family protein [Eubacterium sp.]
MNLPFDYDEDEVRDGFYVAGMTKRVWASQIGLLERFQKFCEKYNLHWYMAYGTLLGAVRHKGFVPWDDDTDIWMMREDFNDMFQIIKAHPEYGFEIRESRDENYNEIIPVLSGAGKRITFDEEYLKNNCDCPYVPCVDTFVLDHVSDNELDEKWRDISTQACVNLMVFLDDLAVEMIREKDGSETEPGKDEKKEITSAITIDQIENLTPNENTGKTIDEIKLALQQIDELTAHKFDENKPLRAQVYLLYTGLIAYFHSDEGSMLRVYPEHLFRKLDGYPKSWFKEQKFVPFETTKLPAPNGADELLRYTYGDYHQVIKGSALHGYPFYKALEQKIIDASGVDPYNYCMKKSDLPDLKQRISVKNSVRVLLSVLQEFDQGVSYELLCTEPEMMLQLLNTVQDTAVKIGNAIEPRLTDGSDAIHAIQNYCEAVFNVYQQMTQGELFQESVDRLHTAYEQLEKSVHKDFLDRQEIVFLIDRVTHWPVIEPLWRAYTDREDCDVIVAMADYYRKKANTEFYPEKHIDLDEMPPYVHAMAAEDYDFAGRHPDMIITQNGFDAFNYTRSLNLKYYTKVLWRCTDKLVYIPWYRVDDFTEKSPAEWSGMKFYARIPGMVYADLTILQSEQMKKNHIRLYREECSDIPEEYWKKKLQAFDKVNMLTTEDAGRLNDLIDQYQTKDF